MDRNDDPHHAARMKLVEEHRTLLAAASAEIPEVEALLASETRPLHRPTHTWRIRELQETVAYHELSIAQIERDSLYHDNGNEPQHID